MSEDIVEVIYEQVNYNEIKNRVDETIDDIFNEAGFSCRDSQRRIIHDITKAFCAGKTDVVVEAPTGIGKSFIAYTMCIIMNRWFSPGSVISTATIPLQEQYLRDFPELPNIKSSSNYKCKHSDECKKFNDSICSMICNTKKCRKDADCQYFIDRRRWEDARIKIANNSYLIHAPKKLIGVNTDFAIFDEAHNLNNSLVDKSSFELDLIEVRSSILTATSVKEYNSILVQIHNTGTVKSIDTSTYDLIDMLRYSKREDDSVLISDDIIGLAKKIHHDVTYYLGRMDDYKTNKLIECSKTSEDEDDLTKKPDAILKKKTIEDLIKQALTLTWPDGFNTIHATLNKISEFTGTLRNMKEGDVIIITSDSKNPKDKDVKSSNYIKYSPNLSKYTSHKILLDKFKYRLYLSATICGFSEFCDELGLSENLSEFICVDSPFEPDIRQLIFSPLIKFSNSNKDEALEKIGNALNEVLPHIKSRVVIHTVSFSNADRLMELFSEDIRNRCITNRSIQDFYNKFKEGKFSEDCIFIGPNLIEGIDFKDDLCRVQYIIKLPYLSLGDKVTKFNMENITNYYSREMIKKLIQAYGRGVRNENDFCVTYILDGNFNRHMNTHLIPQWVKSAIKV